MKFEFIIQLISHEEDTFQKKGLQNLCEFIEDGGDLSSKQYHNVLKSISKLKKSEFVLVRRWLYKAIGLLKEKKYIPYLISQLKEFEDDSENRTWIIAVLHLLHDNKEESDSIIGSSNTSDSGLIARGYFDSDALNEVNPKLFRKILDKNDPLELKWFSLLYGDNKEAIRLENESSKDLLIQLNSHDDPKVAEYSIWALHHSDDGSFTDSTILPHQIFNQEPNVRRWLYRLIMKDLNSTLVNLDLIKEAIDNEQDISAREGLAKGLREYADSDNIKQILTKWFEAEQSERVKLVLLEEFVEHSGIYSEILEKSLGLSKSEVSTTILKKTLHMDLPTVIILTAIKEEYQAVRSYLKDVKPVNKEGTRYEEGILIINENRIAKIVIRECGQSNSTASIEAERAINNFKPEIAIFVGIAGSRKEQDFSIGDVIFPTKIYYYEGGKDYSDGLKNRPEAKEPTFHLSEIAKIERSKNDWKSILAENSETKADLGIIASGEKIIESTDSNIGQNITDNYNDTQAIEMEGFGFGNTLSRQGGGSKIQWCVVRGISDIISHSGDENNLEVNRDRRPSENKIIASMNAAAFALWVIYVFFKEN